MKRLTRVRLINWHNFIDTTIDFKTITYMIGLNAVGKTTIMDAIRYCLTTNKEFNAAGNKKGGRTLQGSVHQKQRAEDSYLRPNHTVSYIGTEFYDDVIKKRFVITVRIESENPHQKTTDIYQDWYITKDGYCLEDLPYMTETADGKKPTKKDAFKLDGRGMEHATGLADARKKICRQLGIGDSESKIGKRFNKVFHMGTSLEDISNIRDFIYAYILPEPEVNIEGLYKDMQELETLGEVLQAAQNKAKALEEINNRITEALELERKYRESEILVAYADWQGQVELIEETKKEKLRYQDKIGVLEETIDQLVSKREAAFDAWNAAKEKLGKNEENTTIETLEKKISEDKKEYEILKKNANDFDETCKRMSCIIKVLRKYSMIIEWDEDYYLYELNKETRISYLEKIVNELRGIEDNLSQLFVEISQENTNLEKEETDLSKNIKDMEGGRMQYPLDAVLVRDAINQVFTERNIKDEAKLLCELLYMTRPEWQECLESYLNTQRFHIVVNKENYWLAKEVFISLRDKVRDAGLIDTVKLLGNDKKSLDEIFTLNQTVDSANIYAKKYVDFLLCDVVCCDDAGDLEKHRKSVTKDRLRYQNFCLKRMRLLDEYIGQDALKKRLEKAKEELREVRQKRNTVDSKYKEILSLNKAYAAFVNGNDIKNILAFCNRRSEAETLFANIQQLAERIAELKRNPILRGLVNLVDECKSEYDRIDGDLTDAKSKKKTYEDYIEKAKVKIQQYTMTSRDRCRDYERTIVGKDSYISAVLATYAELNKNSKAYEIANNHRNIVNRNEKAKDRFVSETLIPLQRQFNADYTMDYAEGLIDIALYRSALQALTRIEIEGHSEKLAEAKKRCKERFQKEVLFRMKDDIGKARRLFKELEKVMAVLPNCGEERYHFYVEGSKNKELGVFYNIIMDKDNKQIKDEMDIFSYLEGPASDTYNEQVEEFMQRIMIDIETRIEQRNSGQKVNGMTLSTYADYRTYLEYDIEVENVVTGERAPLSKVSGDGSGGENQAPFYVAICASLLQIYNQSEDGNSMRLILLDEAFNNMTSDRIEPVMEMFKNMDMQLVLIATPEKCSSIRPYCDITYSIIKQGSKNAIMPFEGV